MDNENIKISEARKRANAKYEQKAYDKILLRVEAGKKAEIKSHAEKYQEEIGIIGTAGYTPKGSVNGFIIRAIDEKIQRDKAIPSVDICVSEPVTSPQEDVVSASDNDIPDTQTCITDDSTSPQEGNTHDD